MEHEQEMTCITCPLGCRLSVTRISESEIAVSGNRCARGEQYAKEEILFPRRVVTATCAVAGRKGIDSPSRVPVRSTAAFPKERVNELLAEIYRREITLPVERGQVVIADALGLGIDVIVTRSMAG